MTQPFIKPDAVECNIKTLANTYGEFVLQPLERGWGTTLGNALRRVLLSSIEGSAVTAVQINGVLHEFTSISGVKEDVTDIILNIKGIHLINHSDEPQIIKLKVKGPANVKAGDIQHDSNIEIVNNDLHIATVNEEGSLDMKMIVNKGRGYVPSELNKTDDPLFVPIDAIYNPVTKVNFEVTQTRVGELTDYDRLKLEIWTNGTIHPQEALKKASELLSEHLSLFGKINEENAVDEKSQEPAPKPKKIKTDLSKVLSLKIAEQDLSKRVQNALEELGVKTVKDLVKLTENDIMKGRNIGQKALTEINEFLENLNLTLGMKV
ncbi:MAG: DNA-directed RNA polymerase subunit alpha [Thermoanaerobaculaceae bacterium]|nr:DNA-directed RNA polymerase subunit alpha [Thermoanaerobaculaceae bacterium]